MQQTVAFSAGVKAQAVKPKGAHLFPCSTCLSLSCESLAAAGARQVECKPA